MPSFYGAVARQPARKTFCITATQTGSVTKAASVWADVTSATIGAIPRMLAVKT